MKFNKYLIMDCNGEWFWADTDSYIDLENNIYKDLSEEHILESREIYQDISKEGRAFRFFQIYFQDKAELFIKVREEWINNLI